MGYLDSLRDTPLLVKDIIMKYGRIIKAKLIRRDNRFIATVDIDGKETRVHVKNTGRCRELLVPGCEVVLSVPSNSDKRKTPYDLVAVYKETKDGSILINMDSQAPNEAVYEWITRSGLFSKDAQVRREVTHGDSRFDVFVSDGEREAFIEVKGVTLEYEGVAAFPDAPTERGAKHINGLVRAVKEGFEAYIIFVIQMKRVNCFIPNEITDPHFADTLRRAALSGVKILAYNCSVYEDGFTIDSPVEIKL